MQNGNFYNGHAIFVSPNGMVVGASGVLNVGSLSVMTPSLSTYNEFLSGYSGDLSKLEYGSDLYKGLITDSQGNIVINGKILSRGDVNIYGKNITIAKDQNSDKTAGIAAGYKGTETFDELSAAETVFNSLVSGGKQNASGLDLQDGKVVLVANAKTNYEDGMLKVENSGTNASIGINNAAVIGSDVEISATAEETVKTTFDKLNSALSSIFDDTDTALEKAEDIIVNYFNGEIYENFDGARASAIVDVVNSNIISKGDTSITADATASVTVGKADENAEISQGFLYALGTKTTSEVNVTNSTINAGENLSIQAASSNKSSLKLSNEDSFNLKDYAAIQFMGLNHSTEANTKVNVDNSTLNAGEDILLSAINSNTSSIAMTSKTPETEKKSDSSSSDSDFETTTQAPSSVGLNLLLKNEKITTEATVTNSSVTSETGSVGVVAQNLNVVSNEISTTSGLKNKKPGSGESKSQFTELKDAVSNLYKKAKDGQTPDEESLNKFTEIFDKSVSKSVEKTQSQMDTASSDSATAENNGKNTANNVQKTDTNNASQEKKQAWAQIGGSMIINKSNIATNAKVDNSIVTIPGALDVIANAVDLTANTVTADATKDADFGAGLAIIVNQQLNDTIANINNSVVNSNGLRVDATTELPMNAGEFKINLIVPKVNAKLTLGIGADSSSDADWDFSLLDTWERDDDGNIKNSITGNDTIDSKITNSLLSDLPFSVTLKSKDNSGVTFENFFNNFAKSQADGDTGSISGSFVYNEIENNTLASITGGSEITAGSGDVTVNAVNSVVNYNAVGVIDFLENFSDIGDNSTSTEGDTFGLGGSVLVNNFDNNAKAYIDNSKVITTGDVVVASASEQAYIAAPKHHHQAVRLELLLM